MNKKIIADIIRTDMTNMNGTKNNFKSAILISVILTMLGAFFFSPVTVAYIPLLMGTFLTPMVFQTEMKNHSEKMFCLLPIERKQLVQARFLMVFLYHLALSLSMYLLAILSMHLKLYTKLVENFDVIALIVEKSEGSFTEFQFLNLVFWIFFAISLMLLGNTMHRYFMNSERFLLALNMKKFKYTKKEIFQLVLIFAGVIFLWFFVSGSIPLNAAGSVIVQLLIQLAEAGNGFLLSTVLVVIALFEMVYQYIATVIEYDEKDL